MYSHSGTWSQAVCCAKWLICWKRFVVGLGVTRAHYERDLGRVRVPALLGTLRVRVTLDKPWGRDHSFDTLLAGEGPTAPRRCGFLDHWRPRGGHC